jgi:hypothetical protein
MASVGLGNTAALGAFQNKIHQEGLDLVRCQINQAMGVFVADPAASFRAGMAVMQGATGLVTASTGTSFLGIAKWNKTTSMLAAKVDEAIVLNGLVATSLRFPNVSNVRVASAVVGGGTVYTVTTDYTVNATNGTVVRVGAGIADGATVYVSYLYQISTSDLIQTQGQNFWNNLDEVSQNESRVTVITDAELLFTTQYDTTRTYTVGEALYCSHIAGREGLITDDSNTNANAFVGRVFQVPTASDPYLGFRMLKGPHI